MEEQFNIDLKVRLEDIPFSLRFINNTCILQIRNNSQFPLQNFTFVVTSPSDEHVEEFKLAPVLLPNNAHKQLWHGWEAMDRISIIKYEYTDSQKVIQVIYDKEDGTYEWRNLIEGDTLDSVIAKKQKFNDRILIGILSIVALLFLVPIIRDEVNSYIYRRNHPADFSSIDSNSNSAYNYDDSQEINTSSMPYISYREVPLSAITIDKDSSLYLAKAHFTNKSLETIKQYDYTVTCYPSGEKRSFVMFGTTGPGEESEEMDIFPDEEMIPDEVVYSYDNGSGYEIIVTYNFGTQTYEVLDSQLQKKMVYKDDTLVGSE